MHVAKIDGVYIALTADGRVFRTEHYSQFTRRLRDELEKMEVQTRVDKDKKASGPDAEQKTIGVYF